MRRTESFLLIGFLMLGITGCSLIRTQHGNTSVTGKLTLTGSSTMAPMISEIARRFEDDNPGVRIDVQTGGSSRGIRDARNGSADLGMSSRFLKPDELEDVTTETVAWDGVTFVVHRSNPVNTLSRQQLVGIYTGQIDNWKVLGGNDAPIIVSNRAEGRSELDLVTGFLGISSTEIDADVIDGETQQSIKTVSTNENAIVYTSVGAAQYAVEQGVPLKLLPLDGVSATADNVQSGLFPLARPLLLILHSGRSSLLAEEFMQYASSAEVDDVATSLGYVPPKRDELVRSN